MKGAHAQSHTGRHHGPDLAYLHYYEAIESIASSLDIGVPTLLSQAGIAYSAMKWEKGILTPYDLEKIVQYLDKEPHNGYR